MGGCLAEPYVCYPPPPKVGQITCQLWFSPPAPHTHHPTPHPLPTNPSRRPKNVQPAELEEGENWLQTFDYNQHLILRVYGPSEEIITDRQATCSCFCSRLAAALAA